MAVAVLLFITQFSTAQMSSISEDAKKVESILSKMTLEEKIDYIGGYQDFYIRAMPRLGLPTLKMSDGPIGVRNYGPATTLAGGIALAATWDPELVRRAAAAVGDDARARGVHFMLGPGVNIYRAPMAGRNFEYFGEDPFLASRTTVAYVEGLQSRGVCATVKHFMGNNQEYDRNHVDSIIDERTLREIYLPVFEAAVKQAHVCAIMDSYNPTNGEHMTQNNYLNNQVVKQEWGFDGIIMSDWGATHDGVAAANGGLDLEMPSGSFMNRATLLPAIKAGKVNEATIDDHVRRILRKAVQFGWLDHEQTQISISLYNLEGRRVALEAARSSMVLLKNDGSLLPLDKSRIKTLAVVGPGAYPAQPVGGGSAQVEPFSSVSYMEGLANYLGEVVKVTYDRGVPSLSELADGTEFSTAAHGGQPGLRAEYFRTNDLSGQPANTGVDEHINFGGPWSPRIPAEFRSARWSGYYFAKVAGTYDAFVQGPGDEGLYRLWLDDKPIVNNWTRANALANHAAVALAPGIHKVSFEYRRPTGESDLRVGIVDAASVVNTQAKRLAQNADAVVVAVGFDPSSECEGSDRTFRLPPGQDELIEAMLAVNRNVIVVITSGGGVDMGRWIQQVPALLQTWYSGEQGGTALPQLLFGEYSPSGKLPVTFDRRWEDSAVFGSYYPDDGEKKVKYSEGIFLGYRHYDKSAMKPLFPFGFGLSYTTFKYSNLSISAQSDDRVLVSFDVTNTGVREGSEVAELYVGDPHSSVPRPLKELKGFQKINLKPSETKHVVVPLDRRAFSYYDVENKRWTANPGTHEILVGGSSDHVELRGQVDLK